jgi:hypothetical protein
VHEWKLGFLVEIKAVNSANGGIKRRNILKYSEDNFLSITNRLEEIAFSNSLLDLTVWIREELLTTQVVFSKTEGCFGIKP